LSLQVLTLDKKYLVGLDSTGFKLIVLVLGTKSVYTFDSAAVKISIADAAMLSVSIPSHVAIKLADGGTALLKLSGGEGRGPPLVEVSKHINGEVSHSLAHATDREGKTILTMVLIKRGGSALGMDVLQAQAYPNAADFACFTPPFDSRATL
jgi:hypothetical protein